LPSFEENSINKGQNSDDDLDVFLDDGIKHHSD